MQSQLDGGTSPNGVLTENFGDWKPQSFNDIDAETGFAIIKEAGKPYITGTLQIGSKIPSPSGEFLAGVKAQGSGQALWWPSFGVHTVIQVFTYHYGDVFGYVIVGKSAVPYELKFLAFATFGILVLLAVMIIMLPPRRTLARSSKTKSR
jgi:hypothetical protein